MCDRDRDGTDSAAQGHALQKNWAGNEGSRMNLGLVECELHFTVY